MLDRLSTSASDLRARLSSIGPRVTVRRPQKPDRRPITGLDIEPGHAIAAQVSVNGSVTVERAAGMPLPPGVVRDGEVADADALAAVLRELFEGHELERRVRVGVANQRVMVRPLVLPPLADAAELDAAVRFKAQDEIPMPPDSVVLDFHDAGVRETPEGPRQHVVLVAARRDMIERLLDTLDAAGLQPEGIDVAAFALMRAVGQPVPAPDEQVAYLSIAGMSNLVIARGGVCVFNRALSAGLETMAATAAERVGAPVLDARQLVHAAGVADDADETVRTIVAETLGHIAADTRNSLDYIAGLGEGARVERVVLCGPCADLPGVPDYLERTIGLPVEPREVAEARSGAAGGLPPSCLNVAAGLAVGEVGT
jgi:type IV pilus assembly protein PilM